MDIKYKESVKLLPVGDFIVELKRDEILSAARRAGYDFGDKLPKKALVQRLAQVYDFFPQTVRRCLGGDALDLISAMSQNDCESAGNAPGVTELLEMGMIMVLDGDEGKRLAVISRRLCDGLCPRE